MTNISKTRGELQRSPYPYISKKRNILTRGQLSELVLTSMDTLVEFPRKTIKRNQPLISFFHCQTPSNVTPLSSAPDPNLQSTNHLPVTR
eukprot:c29319_g1_i1 orf=347-616(-)